MHEKNVNDYIPTYTIDATAGNISAFVRSHKNYIWKIWFRLVPFLILAMLADTIISSFYYSDDETGFIFFSTVAGVMLYAIFTVGSQEAGHIFNFFFYLPLTIYFQPIFTVIGVTALTNYYLYALEQQEKDVSVDDNTN